MSGSETGVLEPFTVGIQKSPVPSQQAVQNMRLAYSADGTAVYKPVPGSSPPYQSNAGTTPAGVSTGGGGGAGTGGNVGTGGGGGGGGESTYGSTGLSQNLNMNSGETMKRKRGRPRKYGTDGSMALALTTSPTPGSVTPSSGAFSPPSQGAASQGGLASPGSLKKARGRPPGSSKKQQLEALGSGGVGFLPHIINVKAGEDVSSKIMSFSQNGPRAVCILSANGAISNVTLRQAATSGGTATYEGRFDILSLSGSFLLTEVGGQRSRTGGLSVSLAGPDGRVLGGCVAGLLTAASPVQVIVGSFIPDGRKDPKPVIHMEPLSVQPNLTQGGVGGGGGGGGYGVGATSPPSRGTLSESSGGHSSPLNQSTGAYNNNSNPQGGMSSMPWK